jgi:tetratricopeptide (TPR) repeat protein
MQIHDTEDALLRGEFLLLTREVQQGLVLFEQTAALEPLNPILFYRQGLSLFEYAQEENGSKFLRLAIRKLKKATQLKSDFIEAWHLLGNAQHAAALLADAEKSYARALSLSNPAESDLYSDYGRLFFDLYMQSLELYDLQKALQFYEKAAVPHSEEAAAEFWIDFGKAQGHLAKQTGDLCAAVKAIDYLKRAVHKDTLSFEGWRCLAHALQTLYELSHEEDHFTQAAECFETALQLNPKQAPLWVDYIRFLRDAGRHGRDVKQTRRAVEVCLKAAAYHLDHAVILALWAEAMALLGELTENSDLLFEAQNKTVEALNLTEKDPEVWYSAGMCALSLAHYLNDFDLYDEVIEKFQIGASLDRSCHRLWHGLATAYAELAHFTVDAQEMDLAVKFFQKALGLFPSARYLIDYAVALSKFGEATHKNNKAYLEQALLAFETALTQQKNAIYLHPDWFFHYACTLDLLGDLCDEEFYYTRAVEIFCHVVMIDPGYPTVHHRLAQAFCHLGDQLSNGDHFYRAIHHLRLAAKQDEENDQIILDWALALIHTGQLSAHPHDADLIYREAERKLIQAVKLGNTQAYYYLGCLHSIRGQYEQALFFIQKADAFKALPSMDEMFQEEWLEPLRAAVDFKDFITHLEKLT